MNQSFRKSLKAALLSLAVLFGGITQADAVDVIDVDTSRVLVGAVPSFPDFYTPNQEASLRTELAAACKAAEAIWDARIIGYSTELPNSLRMQLTNLKIKCEIGEIDGLDGILAQAGPDAVLGVTRTVKLNVEKNNTVPLEATVTFDLEDLGQLSAAGLLTQVAAHEICHAIGFGSFILTENGLSGPVNGIGLSQYNGGQYALRSYRKESGNGVSGYIPLQQTGEGSAGGHWALGVPVFDKIAINNSHDLMLAFVDVANPPNVYIAETTYALLADVGYAVRGFNDHLVAPQGAGTGRWPKITGPGVDPFAGNGVRFDTDGLNFARVSGRNDAIVSTKGAEGTPNAGTGSTNKLDPYGLRNHRWSKSTK
ncbi:MAG: hypothetical protein P8J27_11820 [Mariniblastus sp.]|nr:hypothetical protein [Mariniblastus sp.]